MNQKILTSRTKLPPLNLGMTWNIPPNYLFSLAEVAEVNTLNILFATGENFGEVKKLVSSVKAVFGQSSLLGVMRIKTNVLRMFIKLIHLKLQYKNNKE